MRRVLNDAETQRVAVLDEQQCSDVARRLDAVRAHWVRRSEHFHTVGAATYLDVCGGGGSLEQYRTRLETCNPLLDSVFGDILERVRQALTDLVSAPCGFAPDLARPGFHLFLPPSLDEAKRDVLHLDLQHCHLPIDADVFTKSLTFTLPIEIPHVGAGIEFCRPTALDKRGQLTVQPYVLGELFVHSGRTLHRRAHVPGTGDSRRITMQGHAFSHEGKQWMLYW